MAHSHHGPTTRISRIGIFRLKRAELRRDAAIEQARRRYADEVAAIFAREWRDPQEPAPPPAPAVANAYPWPWLINLRAFARGLRRG